MLTYPSAYSTALASPFKENWIFRLYKSTGTYIGIAFSDVTMDDTIDYTGAVLDAPKIRENISYNTGKASTGNLRITVADYLISSTKLSEILYTGNYINQDVKVYSTLNSNTAMASAVNVFSGRLTAVTFTEKNKLSLSIVSKRQWDNVDLPSDLSDTGVYSPVAYGDFTGYGTTDFMTGKAMYPSPRTSTSGGNIYYLATKSETTSLVHFYDSRAELMANLELDQDATTSKDGRDAFVVKNELKRTYKFRPTLGSGSSMTDPEKAIDANDSTYATASHSGDANGLTSTVVLDLPSFSGKIFSAVVYYKVDMSITACNDTTQVTLKDSSFASPISIVSQTATSSSSFPVNTSFATTTNIKSQIESNNNRFPDSLTVQCVTDSVGTSTASYKVYDVWYQVVVQADEDDEPTATAEAEDKLTVVYSGNDGFDKSWDSGTTATKAHDIHRDILYRYLGVTDTPKVNNTSAWSVIEGEKEGDVRFFTSPDPKPIKHYLDKLAYEAGFVFRFRADGTPCYHFIPNSPSADISLTHSDLRDLKLGHTDLKELTTKWVVQYQKRPSGREYDAKSTHTATNRDNYSFGAKENVKDVKLDFLIDDVAKTEGDRNDSFLNYYDALLGDVKQVLNFKLVNPVKSNVEVGDVIAFSSMKIDPLSGDWSTLKFMVTTTNRGVGGQVMVSAREA